MNFIIIIPARFFSSRFPEKLLANIHGKPMIVRVIEQSLTTIANKIIVATDNNKIKQAIELEYGCSLKKRMEVCLTHSNHQSGTERLSEVIKHYQIPDNQLIVQLQADEPLVSSNMIHQVVKSLRMTTNDISVTTLATPILTNKEFQDHNVVKVVINMHHEALYFSRAQIPWSNISTSTLDNSAYVFLRHIGIYAYYANFINRYIQWIRSPLEQLEMLEQLRVLWYGEKIYVSVISGVSHISVNTPESLTQVNKLFHKVDI